MTTPRSTERVIREYLRMVFFCKAPKTMLVVILPFPEQVTLGFSLERFRVGPPVPAKRRAPHGKAATWAPETCGSIPDRDWQVMAIFGLLFATAEALVSSGALRLRSPRPPSASTG